MNKSGLVLAAMLSLAGCAGQKALAPKDAVDDPSKGGDDSSRGVSASAQDNNTISLRVKVDRKDKDSATITPTSAQVGSFALTPALQGSEGENWRVEALDAHGQVLHKVLVRSNLKYHVETFNPDTGAVEVSRTVDAPLDVFEVSLPFGADVANVNIELEGSPNSPHALMQNAKGRFTRESLTQLAQKSKQTLRATAGGAQVTTLINNGPSAKKMDFVFVGDGYTAAELGKWQADAQKVINGFMQDPLFKTNSTSLNVYRVDVASAESGVTEPDKNITHNTAMGAYFNCQNTDRLLCVDESKVHDIVDPLLAPDARDVIVVVSNSTRYGGGGGRVATLSMHDQAVELALHEIGHTAFALADEYDYGTCDANSEPKGGNASKTGDRSVKWGRLIAAQTPVPTQPGQVPVGTVGVFQGSDYCPTGKFRPTEDSRMNHLGKPWYPVNEATAGSFFAWYTRENIANGGKLLSLRE